MTRILLAILLFCSCLASAQPKAEQVLQKLNTQAPQEKLHLVFNKEAFVAGETIHFRSYVFSGYALSTISTNLYVELYTHTRRLLDKRLVPLSEGIGEGSFTLPSDLPEGLYHIRAYTRWMLNFDPSLQYINSFALYNPNSADRLAEKPVQWNAAAFAESGTLLAGIENQVAVRLWGTISQLKHWKAVVMQSGTPEKTVAEFSSLNKEVGTFRLTPTAGASYFAVITDNFGNTRKVALPPVQQKGVIIQPRQTGKQLLVKITSRNKAATEQYKLIGQMQGQLVYSGKMPATDSFNTAIIPLDSLQTGILHLTLFNEKEQPVAERLVFIKVNAIDKPNLELEQLALTPRGYNHWKLLTDSVERFSYTVVVADTALKPKENILSGFYLTGDLGRSFEEPGWYFSGGYEERQPALDALLITERWKRFDWKQLLKGNLPVVQHRPDQYLSFVGTVLLGQRLQVNRDLNLIFYYSDSTFDFHHVRTDSSGSFVVNDLVFPDSARVYYQLNNKKVSLAPLKLFFEENNRFEKLELPLPASHYELVPRRADEKPALLVQHAVNNLANQQKIALKEKQLEAVVVRTKRRRLTEELNKKLSSPGFHAFDETVFDLVNEERFAGSQDVLSWLRSRITGLQVNGSILTARNSPVNVYINEMRTDASFLNSVPIMDVAMVKFSHMGGAAIQGPALLIYTKRGEKNLYFLGLPYTTVRGYQRPKPFFEIDYQEDLFSSVTNDTRQVLLWKSFSGLRANETPGVRFYHNDSGGPMLLIVTGINKEGLPVYEEKVIRPGHAPAKQSLQAK